MRIRLKLTDLVEELNFFYYFNDFSRFKCKDIKSQSEFFSEQEISEFLEQLRPDLSEEEIEIVKLNVYEIVKPGRNQTQAVERFIQAYNSGTINNWLHWENFPFKNISSNPRVLAKIIAEGGEIYIESDSADFSLEDFQHPEVNPPARLLAYYLKKEPYDDQLVRESIDYYRSCPPDEKAGVFAILYKVLNRLE
jgi:hypothetical protein